LTTATAQTLRRIARKVDATRKTNGSTFEYNVTPHATTTFNLAMGAHSISHSTSPQHCIRKSTKQGCCGRTVTVTANAVSVVTDGCAP
jgi:hypothetical protein